MIILALGGNLPSEAGPPPVTFCAALAHLEGAGVRLRSLSPLYRSVAWPDPADPPYANAAALVATGREPKDLLALLHDTEDRFGRRRGTRWGNRTLDLDLIDYEGRVAAPGEGGDAGPILPHPRCHERAFVLLPLRDVAPDWVHPVQGLGVDALLARLTEPFVCEQVAWPEVELGA